MVPLNYSVTEFPLLWEGTIRCFLSCFECVLPSVFGPEGTDWEPKLDFRMDESSDVPILEERSSSPIDFLQEQWLVGTDIENIERYTDCACSLKFILTMLFFFFSCSLNCIFLSDNSLLSQRLFVFSQRYARDAKPTQQTQGDDAIATEKPRYVWQMKFITSFVSQFKDAFCSSVLTKSTVTSHSFLKFSKSGYIFQRDLE